MFDKKEVKRFLNEIGVPYGLKGRTYIEDAIEYAFEKWDFSITKEVYPAIAEKRETTASKVERAIRHATEMTFLDGNLKAQEKFFGNSISANKGKMSNKAFIEACVDSLKHIE